MLRRPPVSQADWRAPLVLQRRSQVLAHPRQGLRPSAQHAHDRPRPHEGQGKA